VDEAVYRRVMDDYAARCRPSSEREPLRPGGRQYARLRRGVRADRRRPGAAARLTKQELEFRGAIGEIDAAALPDRLREPEETLDECRAGLARLDAHKARFVAAFGSEEALLDLPTRRLAAGQVGDTRGAPRARVQVEATAGRRHLRAGRRGRIGRSEDNDICIQSRGIFRHHAVITATVQGFVLPISARRRHGRQRRTQRRAGTGRRRSDCLGDDGCASRSQRPGRRRAGRALTGQVRPRARLADALPALQKGALPGPRRTGTAADMRRCREVARQAA